VGRRLAAAADRLRRAGVPDARLDAELLMAALLDVDRGALFVRRDERLDTTCDARYETLLRRRERREPLQHILGTQEFYGLEFRVDPRALIPRPETEGLIDAALGLDLPRRALVADLGTGSGCLAVTLASRRPDLVVHAMDRSGDALDLARGNAGRHAVLDRIEFREGDLGVCPDDWCDRMDLVVCNPPYVALADWRTLEPEVRDHDPREALVAGEDGLDAHRRLLPAAFAMLRPEGALLLEIGAGQEDAVRALAAGAGFSGIDVRPDLRGVPRVLSAERRA